MKKIILIILSFMTIVSFTAAVHAENGYSDEYREKLLALYDCLDSQITEAEQTEDTTTVLRFADFDIANRVYSVEGAIDWYDARKVIAMLCGEHPRFLGSVNFMSPLYSQKNPELLTGIRLNRLTIDDTYENAFNQINKKAEEIIAEVIQEGMTDADKALAVYLYLAKNTAVHTNKENFADTVYGALVLNEAACGGFADAFKLLMDKLNIDCEIADSRSVGHLWDYVKIDDRWYHIDVIRNNGSGRLRAECFLIDDELRKNQLLKDERVFDWESIHSDVVCSDTSYNVNSLANKLKDDNLRTLTYENGEYHFTIDGMRFISPSIKTMSKLVSVPVSAETGEKATLNDMKNAKICYFHGREVYDVYAACYTADGTLQSVIKQTVETDSNIRHSVICDIKCDVKDNTDCVKIFTWYGTKPQCETLEVHKTEET